MRYLSLVLVILGAQANAWAGLWGNQPDHTDYETVGASQTAQTLGPVGGTGDVLERIIVNVGTAATGTVTILDGAQTYAVVPANTVVGVYSIMIGARSQYGAWKITTGAGASVIGVGRFQ